MALVETMGYRRTRGLGVLVSFGSQHRAWCPVNSYFLVETGSIVLQVFRREVTFELGGRRGEDGDMEEGIHLPTSSISKPPSLDISKI